MKSWKYISAIFFAGALAVAAPAAQDKKDTAKPDSGRFGNPTGIGIALKSDIYGMVKSIKEDEIILDKTKFGTDQTIKLSPKTKYVRNRKKSSWNELKAGDTVFVDVKTDKKTKEMTAKKITSGIIAGP